MRRQLFPAHHIYDAQPANFDCAGTPCHEKSSTTSPITADSRPNGCDLIAASTPEALSVRDDDQALALVGHIERVQAQYLARPPHGVANRDANFVQSDSNLRLGGNLVQRTSQDRRAWVAKDMHIVAGQRENLRDQIIKWRRVAL